MDITFLYEPRTIAERIGVRRRVLVSVVRGTIEKTIIGKTVPSATQGDVRSRSTAARRCS